MSNARGRHGRQKPITGFSGGQDKRIFGGSCQAVPLTTNDQKHIPIGPRVYKAEEQSARPTDGSLRGGYCREKSARAGCLNEPTPGHSTRYRVPVKYSTGPAVDLAPADALEHLLAVVAEKNRISLQGLLHALPEDERVAFALRPGKT